MSTRSNSAATLLAVGLAALLAGCSAGAPGESGGATGSAASEAAPASTPGTLPGAGATSGEQRRGDEGDISFARHMIPHHEQAIEMSELALDQRHDASARVQELAREIAKAQSPEIEEMTGWLDAWGVSERETADPTASTAIPTEETEDQADHGAEGEHAEGAEPHASATEGGEEDAGGSGGSVPSPSGAASPGAHGDHLGVMSPGSMERLAAAQGGEFDRLWLEMMIDHHAGAVRSARDVLQTTANADVRALAESMITDQTSEIDTMRALLKGTPTT